MPSSCSLKQSHLCCSVFRGRSLPLTVSSDVARACALWGERNVLFLGNGRVFKQAPPPLGAEHFYPAGAANGSSDLRRPDGSLALSIFTFVCFNRPLPLIEPHALLCIQFPPDRLTSCQRKTFSFLKTTQVSNSNGRFPSGCNTIYHNKA